MYRDTNNLPTKKYKQQKCNIIRPNASAFSANTGDYQYITKEELIYELFNTRIAEAR